MGLQRFRSTGGRLAGPAWVLLFAAAVLESCGPSDRRFPESFLFGTSIAGFQVDMGCPTLPASRCDDPASDWYAFVTTPELLADESLHLAGEPMSMGPGFFELYPQDLDLAAHELHNGMLRTSIEWSRLFPMSTIGVEGDASLRAIASPEGLAFYHAVFSAMRARGLEPMVTLNHYTLPVWIHDAVGCHEDVDHCSPRGWLDRDQIIHEIAKYAAFAAREFGGEVDLWLTLNEPFTAVVVPSYIFQSADRSNPPGVFFRGAEAKAATLAMIDAHAAMYDAIHAADEIDASGRGIPARVGIAYNLQATRPKDASNPYDGRAAENIRYIMNELFLDAITKGELDADMNRKPIHRDDLAGHLDFLGVNYYNRVTVESAQESFLPDVSPLLTINPLSLTSGFDDVYPRGLYEVLQEARGYDLPIFITETGNADPRGEGTRARWMAETIQATLDALEDGVPVEGYAYWSLMDNYEWNHGMDLKFGIYAVDPRDPSKQRTPRDLASLYGEIARERRLPADLR